MSGGWRLIDVWTGSEGLKIGIYIRGDKHSSYDGPTEYAFVNKGSESFGDWVNNFQQPFALSTDMKESIKKAKLFVKYRGKYEITFIGHSKGGAEAAANAVATNRNCIIFNPSTVNLGAYGLSNSKYRASMTVYIVKSELVNSLEGRVSRAFDKVVYLPQQYIDGATNHKMIAVIKALKEAGY